jgi:hypothetical protein
MFSLRFINGVYSLVDMRKIMESIQQWLLHSSIHGNHGEVYSWVNPVHQGYLYNEIVGYFITYLVALYDQEHDENKKEEYLKEALKSVSCLQKQMLRGALGRGEIVYAFDTGICLTGLLHLQKKVTDQEKEYVDACIQRLLPFFLEQLKNKNAAINNNTQQQVFDKEKWSLSYGCLLMKMAIPLYLLFEKTQESKYKEQAIALCQELIFCCFHKDHFSINEYVPWVYTHPHCYATEGLLFLQEKGIHEFDQIILKAAQWLAQQQNADGSLYSWYYRPGAEKVKNGDCNAQAIRIWLAVDSTKYKKNIKNGFSFIQTLQSSEGGLYYNPTSQDINSWVSLFTWQAYNWKLHGVNCEYIM